MPAYEFRCRQCGETFVLNRPMSQSGDPAACPGGHLDTVRLLNVAAVGSSSGDAAAVSKPMTASGGGCCGGGSCA